ncbi:MAG TPA: DUF1553 domain-containing protein, partial [Planctomycetaceae bacterium]|nr:DUF1553 domain-containing protein [Planctomycetaceae bacterium]
HFGRGLVASLSEFGIRGKAPSHPELLDWLAAELTEHDWSMKHIHRLIVTSNTYRMSSEVGENSDRNQQVDPENVNLWRMNSQRMEAEVVRDSVLHLAGTLDLTRGGPEIDEKQGQSILRRSLYFRITPNESMEFLQLFDLANPDECYERKLSVVPQQSLALLNSSLSLTQARKIARELNAAEGITNNNEAFVTAVFERILTRPPTSDERERCILFLQEHPQQFAAGVEQSKFPATSVAQLAPSTDPQLRARENLVHVLFSHNDFVTIR